MTTELVLDTFSVLLKGFNETINGYPKIEAIKNDLEELKDVATNSVDLTFWQKDAILSRCNNYLKGEYGDQIKKEDYRSDYNKSLK